MTIRPARPGDAPAIARVESSACPAPWSEGAVRASLGAPTTCALVAVEREVIGHLLSAVAADEGEILTLAVHPAWRRRGVAGGLHDAAVRAWRSRGVRRAFLDVRADNTPAIALYRGRGWVHAGVRRAYYADGADALQMCLEVR